MKKIISLVLSLILMLSCSFSVVAADYAKMTTTKKTIAYEKASMKSNELVTLKDGYNFKPIGETKNYWKIEFKQNDKKQVGYVLKKHAKEQVATNSKNGSTISNKEGTAENKKPPKHLTGWVPYSTSSLKTLTNAIEKGYVVYYDGQYWASPEYVEMLKNENVVYSNDKAPAEPTNRYDLAN